MPVTGATRLGTLLYAMNRYPDGLWERIGGLFEDVDDLLTRCFEHVMYYNLTNDDVAFIETINGREVQQPIPYGALPEDDEFDE